MAWLKSSDTAAHHPIVLAPLAWPTEDHGALQPLETVSMLFGIVNRCAVYSAQYTTDYAIADAVVAQMAGPRWLHWAQLAARAGYWDRVPGGWMLVDDAEHLFHIRRKAELDWERARKRDIANPRIVVPVRLRDGDGCRYCGRIVQWNARRGGRAGTYDHRTPGAPARTPDDLVVCCAQCNSDRGADPDPTAWPLRPTPAEPLYGELTARLLAEHGYDVPISRPANQAGDAPPRARNQRATAHASEPVPGPPQAGSADPTDRGYGADRNPGRESGRVGPGRRRRGRRSGRGPDTGEGR